MARIYNADGFTGGGGALDGMDGGLLVDGMKCAVFDADSFAPYILDDDSAADENSPLVISPDDNPGDKRWILTKGVFAGLTIYGDASITGTLTGDKIIFTNDIYTISKDDEVGLVEILGGTQSAAQAKIRVYGKTHATLANAVRIYADALGFYNESGVFQGTFNSAGLDILEVYKVDGVQVVSNQGVAVADAVDAASVILRLNELLARCRTHGLIAI